MRPASCEFGLGSATGRLRRAAAIATTLASAVALAPPAPAFSVARSSYWPLRKVMVRLDGARVRVGTRVVRIVSESTLCSGEGPSVRRTGVRTWSRFACTYTTFTRRGVDRDLDFGVRILGPARFRIVNPHWVRTPR